MIVEVQSVTVVGLMIVFLAFWHLQWVILRSQPPEARYSPSFRAAVALVGTVCAVTLALLW